MLQSDTDLTQHAKMPRRADDVKEIGFLLVPGFALMSYASAVEPLRAANRLAGQQLYQWHHISLDGAAVQASNGVAVLPEHRVGDDIRLDAMFVCAGGNPALFMHRPTFRWLRSLARKGTQIGGISGGPYLLARAGLLAGHRCTIHWEHIPAFAEEFPEIRVARTLFVMDGDRLTCAGGIAALDMSHALIERDHGHGLAAAVSEWFLHTQIRLGSGSQRLGLSERFNVRSEPLLKALEQMEAHLEEPKPRQALADLAGVSVRQLERLFRIHLRSTVGEQYTIMRLGRAQTLLQQTSMPVLDVAVACGFVSASHFSRAYKRRFGQPPRAERSGRMPLGAPPRASRSSTSLSR